MGRREYCRYIRTYSELEGLQRAHTLCYTASVEERGILMEVQLQQGTKTLIQRVVCPEGEFRRAMLLMQYLCENGVAFEHWLEVLDDVGLAYLPMDEVGNPEKSRETSSRPTQFVAFAGF